MRRNINQKGRRARKSKAGGAGLGCLGCFGVIWMLFVLGFDAVIGYGVWQTYDAKTRFLSTEGVIIASKVESTSTSDGRSYSAEIEFEYDLNGQRYTGDRHSYFSFGTSSQTHSQEIVDRYPVGREVSVYYDPGEPSESVLEVDAASFPSIMILFLTPFHCIGIGFLAGGVLRVVQIRRLGPDDEAIAGFVFRKTKQSLVLMDSHWPDWIVFLSVLGGTTFIAVFVVAFGLGMGTSRPVVLGIWGGCLSMAFFAPTLLRLKRNGKHTKLRIDWFGGRFTRKPDSVQIPIASIRTVRLTTEDTDTRVNDRPWYKHTLSAIDESKTEHLLLIAKGFKQRGEGLRDWFAGRLEAESQGSIPDEDPPSMPVVSEVDVNQTKT